MPELPFRTALIIGAGAGISAALTRRLTKAGLAVALAARDVGKLAPLVTETGAVPFSADAADSAAVEALFRDVDARIGEPEVVIYNASARAQGSLTDLEPDAVRRVVETNAFGGFLAVQQGARRMVLKGRGAILLTGATASIKGFAGSAAFAMGKFALRGLAQSAARELGPKGIHVAHIVIDGGVRSARRPEPPDQPDSLLSPDGIAQTYFDLLRQPRDSWSLEVELRPWIERF